MQRVQDKLTVMAKLFPSFNLLEFTVVAAKLELLLRQHHLHSSLQFSLFDAPLRLARDSYSTIRICLQARFLALEHSKTDTVAKLELADLN